MVPEPAERPEDIDDLEEMGTIECGKEAAKHFAFGDGYRNLNHGMSRLVFKGSQMFHLAR